MFDILLLTNRLATAVARRSVVVFDNRLVGMGLKLSTASHCVGVVGTAV